MGLFTGNRVNLYSIFQRKEVLKEDYIPDNVREFPHRENEINKLVEFLKPVIDGDRSNLIIHGLRGCGKTSVISFVLKSLENEANVRAIHIDCWHHNSPQAVLHMIGLAFGTLKIARRGISTSERIYKLNKIYVKKPTIVALDNAERLLSKSPSVLMDILKIEKVSLILIVKNLSVLSKVECEVMSYLNPYKIGFNPYTPEQIEDILRERVNLAFDSGSVKSDLLKAVSEFTFLNGRDVKLGLNALLKTGQEALNQGSEFVDLKHFEAVREKLMEFTQNELDYLSPPEKDILRVLHEKELKPEELYGQYREISAKPVKQRRFYIYLDRMLNQGLIKSGRGKIKARQFYGRISLNEQIGEK